MLAPDPSRTSLISSLLDKATVSEELLLSKDKQGFSGWAQSLLLSNESTCNHLLQSVDPNWNESVGKELIELCKSNPRLKLDEPLFAKRAFEAQKISAKQFQAACSIWSLAYHFNEDCISEGAPDAPPLMLLALARTRLYPQSIALKKALELPIQDQPFPFQNYPLLGFAFACGLASEWYDPLFKHTTSWRLPASRTYTSILSGASHLTHLAVDALARDNNPAPLIWCAAQRSSFDVADLKGDNIVERVLHSNFPHKLIAVKTLAELGVSFSAKTLSKLSQDAQKIVRPIILAHSEQSALRAQLYMTKIKSVNRAITTETRHGEEQAQPNTMPSVPPIIVPIRKPRL